MRAGLKRCEGKLRGAGEAVVILMVLTVEHLDLPSCLVGIVRGICRVGMWEVSSGRLGLKLVESYS